MSSCKEFEGWQDEVYSAFCLLRNPDYGLLKSHELFEEPTAANNFRATYFAFPAFVVHAFLSSWNPRLDSERLWTALEQQGYVAQLRGAKSPRELKALERAALAAERPLYRFHCDEHPPHCLNTFRACRCGDDAARAQERASELFSAFAVLLEHEEHADDADEAFEAAMARVLARLPCLARFEPRFWTPAVLCNLYNLLAFLAARQLRPDPTKAADRALLFADAALRVGGHVLTLYDLKHALLRRARAPPAPPRALAQRKSQDGGAALRALAPAWATSTSASASAPSASASASASSASAAADPRLHFVLCCGTRSCPAPRVLPPAFADAALDAAVADYLARRMPAGELLPRFVGWYLDDFGGEDGVRRFFAVPAGTPLRCAPWDYAPRLPAPRAFARAAPHACGAAPPHAAPPRGLFLFAAPRVRGWRVWAQRGARANGARAVALLAPCGDALVVTAGALQLYEGWGAAPELLGAVHGAQPAPWEEMGTEAAAEAAEKTRGMLERLRLGAFKVGVLEVRRGQKRENEFFANCHEEAGQRYLRVLERIGEKVPLKGWERYAGGLDTGEKGENGTHSLFTEYVLEDGDEPLPPLEIMFHVSTMMPLSAKDEQQIQRKRHLGNDAVVIIFVEEAEAVFDPHELCSKYTQVYLVVQFDAEKGGFTIEPWLRQGVPFFEPLVRGQVFPDEAALVQVLLPLVVRANICSFYGSSFQAISKKTREFFLKNI